MKTIFEHIIEGSIQTDVIYEDEHIICIHDKFPQAPVHLLLITKKVIPSIHKLEEKDMYLLRLIFSKAKELAHQFGVADSYRILTNHGTDAGQTVMHLHFHLLGGKVLAAKGG